MKIRIEKATAVPQLQQLHQQYLYNPPTIMKQFVVLNMTIDRLQLLHYIQLIRAQTMTENFKKEKQNDNFIRVYIIILMLSLENKWNMSRKKKKTKLTNYSDQIDDQKCSAYFSSIIYLNKIFFFF